MAICLDEAETAIRAIRRITKLPDLDQVQAVLAAKRLELINNSRAPRPGLARPAVNKLRAVPKGKTDSKLDPLYRQDPVYQQYISANNALMAYCKEHSVSRTAVPRAVREPYELALADWLAVKPKYKLGQAVHRAYAQMQQPAPQPGHGQETTAHGTSPSSRAP